MLGTGLITFRTVIEVLFRIVFCFEECFPNSKSARRCRFSAKGGDAPGTTTGVYSRYIEHKRPYRFIVSSETAISFFFKNVHAELHGFVLYGWNEELSVPRVWWLQNHEEETCLLKRGFYSRNSKKSKLVIEKTRCTQGGAWAFLFRTFEACVSR